jgi:hypothetical protein
LNRYLEAAAQRSALVLAEPDASSPAILGDELDSGRFSSALNHVKS